MLRIDPDLLTSAVVVEDLVGTGEAFPHVYGPIDARRRRRRHAAADRPTAIAILTPRGVGAGASVRSRTRRDRPRGRRAPGGRRGGGRRPSPSPAARPPARPPRRRAVRGWRSGRGRARRPRSPPARRSPGSWSCLQSRNRQCSIRSNTSANARSMPSPDSHRLSARTPGVSISQPPPGSGSSSAATVVWRPRWSPLRTSVVACTCDAEQGVDERRLADAAGAEERERAAARRRTPAAPRCRRRVRPLVTSDRHAERHLDSSRRVGSGSSTRSALVSTTTGSAPLSNASTSSRSSRRWFGGVAERSG